MVNLPPPSPPFADDSNKFSCKFSILEFSNETTGRAGALRDGWNIRGIRWLDCLRINSRGGKQWRKGKRKLTFNVFRSSAELSIVHLFHLPFSDCSLEIVFTKGERGKIWNMSCQCVVMSCHVFSLPSVVFVSVFIMCRRLALRRWVCQCVSALCFVFVRVFTICAFVSLQDVCVYVYVPLQGVCVFTACMCVCVASCL